jgi:Transposase
VPDCQALPQPDTELRPHSPAGEHQVNGSDNIIGTYRQVRDRLFAFYDWCAQNEQVTELTTLAATISRWEDEIVTAILTGVTNATSESLTGSPSSKPASPTAFATPPASAAASAPLAPAAPAGEHPPQPPVQNRW